LKAYFESEEPVLYHAVPITICNPIRNQPYNKKLNDVNYIPNPFPIKK